MIANQEYKRDLEDLKFKVDLLGEKMDHMLELGQVNEEQISEIKNTLGVQSGMLRNLTQNFSLKIAKLNGIILVGSCFFFLILLWIVFKI